VKANSSCIPLRMAKFVHDSFLASSTFQTSIVAMLVAVFSFFECLRQYPFYCVTKWLLSLCTSRDTRKYHSRFPSGVGAICLSFSLFTTVARPSHGSRCHQNHGIRMNSNWPVPWVCTLNSADLVESVANWV